MVLLVDVSSVMMSVLGFGPRGLWGYSFAARLSLLRLLSAEGNGWKVGRIGHDTVSMEGTLL